MSSVNRITDSHVVALCAVLSSPNLKRLKESFLEGADEQTVSTHDPYRSEGHITLARCCGEREGELREVMARYEQAVTNQSGESTPLPSNQRLTVRPIDRPTRPELNLLPQPSQPW